MERQKASFQHNANLSYQNTTDATINQRRSHKTKEREREGAKRAEKRVKRVCVEGDTSYPSHYSKWETQTASVRRTELMSPECRGNYIRDDTSSVIPTWSQPSSHTHSLDTLTSKHTINVTCCKHTKTVKNQNWIITIRNEMLAWFELLKTHFDFFKPMKNMDKTSYIKSWLHKNL